MNSSDDPIMDLVRQLLMVIVTAAVTWFFSRRKQQSEIQKTNADAGNAIVESSAKVAQEWSELYTFVEQRSKAMEARIADLEQRLSEAEKIKLERMSLEQQVKQLAAKVQRLIEAFEFLAKEVEQTHPQAVAEARKKAATGPFRKDTTVTPS